MKKKGQVVLLIGAQWGDEGKGKVIDHLADEIDIVIRFNGGHNAGHTLTVNGVKTITHLLPSGVIRPNTINLLGSGVVVDPVTFTTEFQIAEKCGAHVMIDNEAPIILPIHAMIDNGRERAKKNPIGTTGRGIGPAYEDLWARRGLRAKDMVSEDKIRHKLEDGGYYAEKLAIAAHLRETPQKIDEVIAWCAKFISIIEPCLVDTRCFVAQAIKNGQDVLFEGAQGVMLDAIHGAQPYSTSSTTTAAGVATTFGIFRFNRVIGVAKAPYLTRVGGGPLPTKLNDQVGEWLRMTGHEYGATTGRPRDCGWQDLMALRYACRVGGINELFLTKLDVASTLKKIQVCKGYKVNGRTISPWDSLTLELLQKAEPQYTQYAGWQDNISNCRNFDDLPVSAQGLIADISAFTGVKVTGIGVGPERGK